MGPQIVAEKTIKLAGQELLGFVTLGSLPADRVKRHFGVRQWLFHAFLRVAFVLTGFGGASVFTRKAWLGHFIPSRSGAFAIAHSDASLRYFTASRKALA